MTLPEVELLPSEENVSQDTTCYHVEQDEFAHKAKCGIVAKNSNFKAHFGFFPVLTRIRTTSSRCSEYNADLFFGVSVSCFLLYNDIILHIVNVDEILLIPDEKLRKRGE